MIRKILGISLLSAPFIAITVHGITVHGYQTMLFVWIGIILLMAVLMAGIFLIFE